MILDLSLIIGTQQFCTSNKINTETIEFRSE
ncbi:hypothetical protein Pint_27395 [Pistacia integerrima]|uniref:Uncharacterized protein n=1 Tax=Pistacia integerrima TaxID=434235 RepID=A0ACC0YQC2_9ROSI|nr:hypothetical protein Pint_27395 [Pistacia integerrima]